MIQKYADQIFTFLLIAFMLSLTSTFEGPNLSPTCSGVKKWRKLGDLGLLTSLTKASSPATLVG